ncbi:uncharacterized protein BJ171DRAFT_395255, partial [Polychytrium aggregatum]|uniref:uncharacterized protein n=1 Tax=Polychytrium aggregatum TaxID=110093 RepID=UPI0022FDCA9D
MQSSMLHSLIIAYKLHEHMSIIPPEIASIEDLKEFHSSDYYLHLCASAALSDRVLLTHVLPIASDCPIFPNLANYVRLVAGGTISAAKLLTEGGYDVAIHWDGGRHHGKRDSACGFCYINDIVLGILELHKKYERILYLDLDIHHGDGVEQAFQTTSKVLTVSFHKYEPGFFPGTGSIDDVGYGKGLNHSLNIPLRPGFSGVGLRYLFSRVIDSAMENYNPDAIVIQCGADGLANDPLVGRGGWNLDERSIGECVAKTLSFNKPTLVLGGGGYGNPNAARCWAWCTAVIVQQEELISEDIPDHPFLNKYGPDFRLPVDLTFYKDRNDTRYVDDVIKKV